MEKFLLGIKKRLLCIVLSVSMVCSTTAATTYQAAAIPVAYTGWEVLVTVLLLLGISICAAEDHVNAQEEATREIVDKFAGWKVLNGKGEGDNNGDGEDDAFAFDPLSYLLGNKLTIPEDDLKDWQDFAREQGWTPNYEPVFSDVNLYGCTAGEYQKFFADYFGCSSTDSYLSKFVNASYDDFVLDDYTGVFCSFYWDPYDTFWFFPIESDWGYIGFCYGEFSTTNSSNYLYGVTSNGPVKKFETSIGLKFKVGTSSTVAGGDIYGQSANLSYDRDSFVIVKGQIYDLKSICHTTENITTSKDYGNIVYIDDFGVPDNHFSDTVKDSINSVGDTNLGHLVESGDYDVIGGGREYDDDKQEAVGDITVTMPSSDVLEAYQNGLITYEQMLDALGVTPIDESNGTNLLTNDLLDTNRGILLGVDKLVNFVGNIWNFLSNMIGNLIDALINMFSSLFVPSAGYFEAYFTKLDSFLADKLGVLYLPIDLLIDILNAFVSADKSDTTLHFPGIIFQEYVIVPEQDVNLDVSGRFPFLQTAAHFISSAILTFGLIMQLRSKLREVLKR